jgi:hypothetical protein
LLVSTIRALHGGTLGSCHSSLKQVTPRNGRGIKISNYHKEAVVKKRMLVGLFMLLAIWALGACIVEPELESQEPYSRCDLFADEELSVVLYGIYPGDTTVKMYVKFENGAVIGLEDGREDGLPWKYSAKIGEVESFGCDIFEGEEHAGRLYCMLPLPHEYRNAAKEFVLRVNGCPEKILSIPQLSLLVEKTSAGSGGSGSSSGASGPDTSKVALPLDMTLLCGSAPPTNPDDCTPAYEAWCHCMGGMYSCLELWEDMCSFE